MNYGAAQGQQVGTYGAQSVPVTIKQLPATWVIDGKGIIVEKANYLAPNKLTALLDKAMH